MQGPVDETDYDIQTNTVRKQGNLRYLSLGLLLNSPQLLNIYLGLLYCAFPLISEIHVFSCI